MIKSTKKFFVICLAFILIPFVMTNVHCDWIYTNNKIDIINPSQHFDMILDSFIYHKNPVIPDTPEGNLNGNTLEQIMGDIADQGLNNPDSVLNDALKKEYVKDGEFVTSIDINRQYNGEQFIKALNIPEGVHFAIYKELTNKFPYYQIWHVMTTSYPIDTIKNENGKFVPEKISPIYRQTYRWEPDFVNGLTSGTYTAEGPTKIGYCPTKINTKNNPNKPFFDPTNFVEGISLTSLSIIANTELKSGDTQKLTLEANPKEVDYTKTVWKINPSNAAKLDKNNNLIINELFTGTIEVKATLSGLTATKTINVTSPNPLDNPVNIEYKERTIEGILYPANNCSQEINITIPRKKTAKIIFESYDNQLIVDAYYTIDNKTKQYYNETNEISIKEYSKDRIFHIHVNGNSPIKYKISKK